MSVANENYLFCSRQRWNAIYGDASSHQAVPPKVGEDQLPPESSLVDDMSGNKFEIIILLYYC